MKRLFCTVAPIAIVGTAASAGETVLYGDSPEWVVQADINAAIAADQDVVLYDRQLRLDGGVVTRHTDSAQQIDSTQALQQNGTLQFSWMPDKGDLTIHRLALYRGGEVIDLLAQGVKPEVIRREEQLEDRSVDGQLTAVVAVPGMRVGDVLRATTSTTLRDQALDNEMQATEGVYAEPAKVGFGRLRVSWPDESDVHWGTLGQIKVAEPISVDGYRTLEVIMPIAKPEPMPEDAPERFTVAPSVQVGTYATWEEVSSSMAPHFTTSLAVQPGGAVAREIEKIKAATDDPAARAALALQLVQDEISYLANGMDGGNYLPQTAEDTWELRYGDCKAKSLLLLSMLREMGIESQVVLVNSEQGDAVSVSRPMPSAFDHMIVRATIEGTDYWLDGTDSGTRLDTMYEVPAFTWALPLTEAGAGLTRMEQRWPKVADRTMSLTFDMTNGVDLPVLFDVEVVARGVMGARMRPQAAETDPRMTIANANAYLKDLLGGLVHEAEFSYDEKSGFGRLKASGLLFDEVEFERNMATTAVYGPTVSWEFTPDRARAAWREIPYRSGGPLTRSQTLVIKLPDGGEGVRVVGTPSLDEIAAATRFQRSSSLSGDTFTMTDSSSFVPTEIQVADLPAERAAIRRIASGDPVIQIIDPTRHWELDDGEVARRTAPFLSAQDTLVELIQEEGKPGVLMLRAFLNAFARRHDAAIADLDLAIDQAATSELHAARAGMYADSGRLEEAVADAQMAYDLKGDFGTVSSLATLLAFSGRAAEGLDLIDSLASSGEERIDQEIIWSELAGHDDREGEAWDRLSELMERFPDRMELHNARCWSAGIWAHRIEEAQADCDRAVELSNHAAGILDSRALLYHRMGRDEDALRDLAVALEKAPDQAASRYLRGLIRLSRGDEGGRQDLVQAKRISPAIERRYHAWGLSPAG